MENKEGTLLKRILSYKNLLICIFSAIGYGFGWSVPIKLGLNMWLSLLICLIVGLPFYLLIEYLFSKDFIKENKNYKIVIGIGVIISYVISWYFIKYFLDFDNNQILLVNVVWVVLLEIVVFVLQKRKSK